MMCNHAFCSLLLAASLAGLLPAREPPPRPTSFQLYYGKDAAHLAQLARRMKPGQVVVVDLRVLTNADREALLRAADRNGARVLAYLSIGELHEDDERRFRDFLKTFLAKSTTPPRFRTLDALTLERNERFKSRRIDVLAEAWRAFVLAEAERLHGRGVHGLFVDTVDTVDLYIRKKEWSLDRRRESVEAMMSLVRAIKARDREKFVLQNGGLNLVGARVFIGDDTGKEVPGLALAQRHRDNPDGVLWENAFARQDEWSRRKEKELHEIQQSGRATVFALGYKKTLGSADSFFRKCATAGFVAAWGTSSERLHREPAVGPLESPPHPKE